jgi:hypothetical protein
MMAFNLFFCLKVLFSTSPASITRSIKRKKGLPTLGLLAVIAYQPKKVEEIMNIEFVGKEDMLPQNQICIQQIMYCRVLNQMKQNLLKKDRNNKHNVQVGLKRPKEYKTNNEKKNYQQSKTEFYISRSGVDGRREEFKVSMTSSTKYMIQKN